MKFGPIDRFLTGVALPVAALRSRDGSGVGEFADLPAFGRWCARAGMDLIQVLPVNDTGANSSPYSSLSAFALHPLYLHLQDVPGAGRHMAAIEGFRLTAEPERRFSYPGTLSFKLLILEQVFAENERSIRADEAFAAWRAENPWVTPYAVFKALKAETADAPWASWGEAAEPTEAGISRLWLSHEPACLFHAWIQYLLEGQLREAVRALEELGIRLKGDIPILMSEESADVWSSRRYFDLSVRAGAPPDMYSAEGQNWGFPVYDWDALARDGYGWWTSRLRQAEKFFHAFRIDHVLGFFRIWCIPRTERRGLLGVFSPSVALTRGDLEGVGMDAGRIRWLSVPHAHPEEIDGRFGEARERIRERCFDRVGAEELFTLKPEVDREDRILELGEEPAVTGFLLGKHADRALLPYGVDRYVPTWYFWESSSFVSLGQEEQARLRGLIEAARRDSEAVWEERGRRLLTRLRDATDMLVCAEDLGDVPDCVPRVLSELGILGLRVERWAREYGAPGAPFVHPESYPRLTVATGSVHDTSTLRGWWEENREEREAYHAYLGGPGECPARMTPELLSRIVSHLLDSTSLLCILQLQDLLDLEPVNWSADPAEDRVNVPGTVSDRNWTWRMPVDVGELAGRAEPAESIRALTTLRAGRPLA